MADTPHYDVGAIVPVAAVMLEAQTPVDPQHVIAKTRAPDGTLATYTYGVDSQLTRQSTGHYTLALTLSVPGVWRYRVAGTGTSPADNPVEGTLVADPDLFDPSYSLLPSYALCSLDEVKQYNGIDVGDESNDDLLVELIDDVSTAILNYIDTEVTPWVPNPSEHVFDVDDWVVRNRVLPIGALQAIDDDFEMTVYYENGDLWQTVDGSQVVGEPRLRKPWEPIEELRFPLTVQSSGPALLQFWRRQVVKITGNWGWPKVPADLRRYAVVQASTWYARDVSKWSQTFNLVEERVESPRTLSPAIREGLDQAYRRWEV